MSGQWQKTTQNRNTLETTSSQKERKILLIEKEEKDKEELGHGVQTHRAAPRSRINLQDNVCRNLHCRVGAAISGSAEGQERDNGLYSRYWERVQLEGKQTRWVWCLTTVITPLCGVEESSKLRSLRPAWSQ